MIAPAFQAAIPLWQTFLSIVGISSLISTALAHWLSSRSERIRWKNDNKKAEWRELIDQLDKSMKAMSCAFRNPNVIRVDDASQAPDDGIVSGDRALENRLFILETLRKNGIIQEWKKLVDYVSEASNPPEPSQRGGPTAMGFSERAVAFRDNLLRVARKDLGL
jgi:hypothetical protein